MPARDAGIYSAPAAASSLRIAAVVPTLAPVRYLEDVTPFRLPVSLLFLSCFFGFLSRSNFRS